MEQLMTTEEVAEYLKVDVVTVRRLINRGELGGYRVGGEYRFTESDIENYLKIQRVHPATFGGEEMLQSDDPIHIAFMELAKRMGGRTRDRFEKFTERARRVMSLAQAEALLMKHNYIGTEHLLLGLVREGDGVAAEVLRNLNVDLQVVRSKVESIIGWGNKVVDTEIGLTPRAKKVIELAVDEARRMGHHYIGTEHLLLGLIREGEGIGAKVLNDLGVALERVRAETLRVLTARQIAAVEPPAAPPEAETLLKEGEQGQTCPRCSAQNPIYFRHCFNCGNRLA
ncbi:MAG: Clp protease N-terminal domain-containing protein [Ktedonobacteraceae bacterium]